MDGKQKGNLRILDNKKDIYFSKPLLSDSTIFPSQLFTAKSDCVVVVPTYNECDNIAHVINALKSLSIPVDILIVDDNSPDGTSKVVEDIIKSKDGVYLMRRETKSGLGSAYKAGFRFALQHGWDYICQMDADFSHNPQDIAKLLDHCKKGSDVAIGSRYIKGGCIKGWPLKRWLISRCANVVAQVMLKNRISDLTGGFKCFTRLALKQINLDRIASEGYIFQVEMNYRAKQLGLEIAQQPICFTDRTRGQSKMGPDEAKEGIRQLWRLRK